MLRRSIVMLLLASATAPALADVLVLKDGRRLTGTVEEGDGVYVVQHAGKKLTVPDTLVAEWIAGNTDADAAAAVPLDEVRIEAEPTAPAVATEAPATDAATAPGGQLSASMENNSPMAQVDRRVVVRTERAVAFAVGRDLLVTSASVVTGGASPQLMDRAGDAVRFEVVRSDEKLGLALLRVTGTAPLQALMLADSFDAARVTGAGPMRLGGYIGPDLFQPAMEFVDCAGEKPSAGKPWTVKAAKHPGTPGGPVLFGNLVIGVQLAGDRTDAGAVPVVPLDQLRRFLGKDYVKPKTDVDPATGAMQFSAEHERAAE